MLTFIVDDNPDDRLIILHQLRGELAHATAVEIGTAEELDAAFAHHRPSLVITDLALGWGTGIDVLQRTKSQHPACPVIMFTGAGDEQAAVEAMKMGLDDYVVKDPRRLSRLRQAIRDIADRGGRSAQAQTPAASPDYPPGGELLRRVRDQVQDVAQSLAGASGLSGGAQDERIGLITAKISDVLEELDAAMAQPHPET
ncbi:response regulator [Methylobacterium nodulans]|uniref:Response regulator receiver protein n=1 Tax=Methylobacterium nodulans (strain LMG 21967 / CNCM I-2342 / ORS 2060) TaxID=460265 RepID=B8ICU4_METNO|nr:response regulator [Methylobacterium nodulans]ACL57505.1 response regulator receiver protein [Methylobacterium nodulans ORS 2060]